MSKKFDELFRDIVTILRRDYAGQGELDSRFDPRYYTQAIGQAWHDEKLDELLFLRYVSQMLACTGDRHLRLELLPGETYTPWSPGFFTRRYEDSLYVTAVTGETRLSPGDRIIAVNGGAPSAHRAHIQKNFFYSDEPEREDWNGLLKMAGTVTVQRPEGGQETLELARRPRQSPRPGPALRRLEDGTVYVRPGPGPADELAEALREHISGARGLVIDMRWADGGEGDLYPLLPFLCRERTPLTSLLGDEGLYVNYTPLNCALKAAGLEGIPGAEEYIAELRKKSGRGFLREDDGPEDATVPGLAPPTVAVLTDTWCRDGGEVFVQAANSAGAVLIGRPTLGTLDYSGDVRYALDERYILTWPTAVTAAARDGHGMKGAGIAPNVYIPWTPEECSGDVLLRAARTYLSENS